MWQWMIALGMVVGMSGMSWGETIHFAGITGGCKSAEPGCGPFQVGVGNGREYTGQFTYETFVQSPDQEGVAAQVTNFTVTFQGRKPITLTAEDAVLIVHRFDAHEQWAAVIGRLPHGWMAAGIQTTELPVRHDLLNETGVQWNCRKWQFCGFEIAADRRGIPSPNPYGTAVNSYQSKLDGDNGTLYFFTK